MIAGEMLLEEIADQVTAKGAEPLSEHSVHASTRALIDWVAATLVGTWHPATSALRAALAGVAGPGSASVVGTPRTTDPRTAALVNATGSHALEVDDIYRDGLYHPGSPTIAAALAISQQHGSNGAEFLRSVAIGYEVGCRLAKAINPSHYAYWHTTGTVGTVGSAVAASSALQLDSKATANAIALAATLAAGLQQSFRSEAMAKPLHAGHAADAGVLVALAAAQGMTGALDVLDGPAGFLAAMSEGADVATLVAPWDEPWAVSEVTVKNHTACGHTFAPIDAALSIRAEHDFGLDEIRHVVIETAQTPINVAGNLDPHTEFEAKFSLSFCVASALSLGSVRLRAFTDEGLSDASIRSVMKNTELQSAERFNAVFPNRRGARVVVELSDHTEPLAAEVWTRHGDPDDPLSDDELSDKFLELAGPTLGADGKRVLDRLWRINDASDVSELLAWRLAGSEDTVRSS